MLVSGATPKTFDALRAKIAAFTCNTVAAPGVIESLLVCPPAVTREGAGATLTTPKAALRITPAAGTTLTTVETCDYRGHHGTDEKIQRLRFAPAAPSANGTIAYDVRFG